MWRRVKETKEIEVNCFKIKYNNTYFIILFYLLRKRNEFTFIDNKKKVVNEIASDEVPF